MLRKLFAIRCRVCGHDELTGWPALRAALSDTLPFFCSACFARGVRQWLDRNPLRVQL